MMIVVRVLIFFFLVFFLFGCSNTLRATVTRFHQLPAPSQQTFIVVAQDEALTPSLEFQHYVSVLSEEMRSAGFVSSRGPTADLIVRFAYNASSPREKMRREHVVSPVYGSIFIGGWPYGYYPYGFVPWSFSSNLYPYEYSYTVFDVTVAISIEQSSGVVVFEGRAAATLRKADLTIVVPALIDALFADFPGQSGETIETAVHLGKANPH